VSSIQRVGDGAAVVYPLLDLLLLVNSLWQDLHQYTVALCMWVLALQGIADLRSARLLQVTIYTRGCYLSCGRDHPCWPKGISLSRVKGHKESGLAARRRRARRSAGSGVVGQVSDRARSTGQPLGNKGEKRYPGKRPILARHIMDTRLRVARGIAKQPVSRCLKR
jgi:hypothetical protein